jgi:ABC-type nitrate/sulfonate/bicarbonate transport system substrate-binding protein
LLALFSAKGNVRSVKDLEGKVIGIGALGSLLHQLAVAVLLKHDVDVTKIRFLNVGSNTDVFRSVIAGTVDAGAGPASYISDAARYKVHAVENGDMSVELPEFTYQGGWTSTRAIETQRDQIVRVMAAYLKLFRFVQEPSSRDAFLLARRAAFPGAQENEHVSEWDFLQRTKPLSQDLVLSPERVRYLQQINLDFQVQKEMLPYERVVDPTLAQDALKLVTAS